MKLSTKIFGGFVFLLVLTITMAYLGWHNLKALNADAEQRDTLNLIMKNALEARRQEKNYLGVCTSLPYILYVVFRSTNDFIARNRFNGNGLLNQAVEEFAS